MGRLSKFATSFLKRRWTLEDYPIRIRFTKPELPPFAGPGLKPVPWSAQIEGWLLSGHGQSREEALADLQARFEEYKSRHRTLPRPGTKAPIAFASTDRISRLDPIAQEFFRRVFELEPEDCLITDESSLSDFTFGNPVQPVIERIEQEFGIDASSVEAGNVVDLLELIAAKRSG